MHYEKALALYDEVPAWEWLKNKTMKKKQGLMLERV
jgi:hypothetical protein